MTPAERDEGRRLLAKYEHLTPPNPDSFAAVRALAANYDAWEHAKWRLEEFLMRHADALLADHEAIRREAVREFAEDLSNRLLIEARETNNFDTVRGISVSKKIVDDLVASSGVELNKGEHDWCADPKCQQCNSRFKDMQ